MDSNRKTKQFKSSGAPRRVVVALRMAGIAGQDKLNGIFNYLSEGRRWQLIIYRTKHEFTAETVRHELERKADGFIVGIPKTEDALCALAATNIPTVVMNVSGGDIERRKENIAFVKSDSQTVGREAAHALLKQGVYKSYGYVGYRTDDDWSRERGTAFRDALDKAGFVGRMMDITHYKGNVEDKATILEWLQALPKPSGILAACDDRAFEILDICRDADIKVPAEIGILGVNNDPLLCENAEPRLSSIQPDFVEEGRLAAELLEKMMSGGSIPAEKRLRRVGIRAIVHRDSTVAQSEAGKLVQKVLAYIEREAVRGIGVEDVARRFKVSRSLLEMRFRELQNESVYEAMLRIRLAEVKRRLRQTEDPISEITMACGWENPTPPKALFKRRFGISMREYRKGISS
ncbi:MAG: substrate-binding domain-containing protein [Kiritimatiellae bacterium]|nr:substrate-binding domain-containing protein [Kiritimatiellia bacterium]